MGLETSGVGGHKSIDLEPPGAYDGHIYIDLEPPGADAHKNMDLETPGA